MKKIAISQLTTLRWDLEQEVQAAAQRGVKGLGIWRPKLDDYGVDATAELLFENGLSASSLSWAGGFTGSDGRSFDDAVEDALHAVRDAELLGTDTLIVLAGGRNNHIKKHLRKTLCRALREIDAAARVHEVQLAIEPIHPGCGQEWSFVNDVRTTLDILAEVGSRNIGLVLDTYHLGIDEELGDWLPEVIPYLQLVQLGDGRHSPLGEMNRCLLGDGNVPLKQILDLLTASGYDRWLEIELLGADVERLEYEEVLDHSLSFLNRSGGLMVEQ